MTSGIPARAAAVIVGHGERGGSKLNAALKSHRDAIAGALPDIDVTAGVLSGEPTLEAALACAAEGGAHGILVYPFFMSDGYFVKTAIPKRIAAAGLAARCDVLPPLGADPGLVAIMARDARAAAGAFGHPPSSCRLLLAGHGSEGSRASAEATRLAAVRLAAVAGFALVDTAFLEEPPFLADAIAADARPTVVVGFFSGEGLHAVEDVPAALAAAEGPITYTGAVGAAAGVDALIRASIRSATENLQNS